MDIDFTHTQVHDLGLAAALTSKDFEFSKISKDSTGRVFFLFESTSDLEQAIRAYQSNTLDVKARTFFDNTKMLKGIIYLEKSSP